MAGTEALTAAPGETPDYKLWVEELKKLDDEKTKFEVDSKDEAILGNVLFWMDDPEKAKKEYPSDQVNVLKNYVTKLGADQKRMQVLENITGGDSPVFINSKPRLHEALLQLKKYIDGTLKFPEVEVVPGALRTAIPMDQNPDGTPATPEQPKVAADAVAAPNTTDTVPGTDSDTPATKPGEDSANPTDAPPTDGGKTPDEANPGADPAKTDVPPDKKSEDTRSFLKRLIDDIQTPGSGGVANAAKKMFTALAALIGKLNTMGNNAIDRASKITPDEAKTIEVKIEKVKKGTKIEVTDKSHNPSVEYVKRVLSLNKPGITDAESLRKELSGLKDSFTPDFESKMDAVVPKLQAGDIVFFRNEKNRSEAGSVAIVSRIVEEPREVHVRTPDTVGTLTVQEYNLAGNTKFKTLWMGYLRKKTATTETEPEKTDPVTPTETPPPKTDTGDSPEKKAAPPAVS